MELYLRKQLSIAVIIYTGQILVGYGLGWSAPIVSILLDPENTPLQTPITQGQSSWVGSVLYIGTIIGPYVSSYFSNSRGRKTSLFLGGFLTIFSFFLLAIARNLAMIFAGRIFTGLGTGIIFVTNLVYIGEIASTNIRGILLTAIGISGTFGTLFVYTIGHFVPYALTSWFGFLIAVVYFMGVTVVPESPMFYIIQGRDEEAKKSLIALGREEDIPKLLFRKDKIVENEKKSEWKDLYRIKSNMRAFIITLTLNILVQGSGIIVVTFFATNIFAMAGSSIEAHVATIIIGITQVVSSSIAPFFVDRSGRRMLLMVSTMFCTLSLSVLGVYFYLYDRDPNIVGSVKWLPLVLLIIFFLTYDLGFGVIPGTLVGEMFAPNVRSIGSAITVTSAWVFGFGVASSFGYLIALIGTYGTFWLFASSCAIAFMFTFLCIPETKGKSLIEIQEMLSK